MPQPIEVPILAYGADGEINQVQWSSSQPDWICICYRDNVEILRVQLNQYGHHEYHYHYSGKAGKVSAAMNTALLPVDFQIPESKKGSSSYVCDGTLDDLKEHEVKCKLEGRLLLTQRL